MKRRDFVKFAGGGIAALVVGSVLPAWVSKNKLLAVKQVQELNFTITDAVKNMITHNQNNSSPMLLLAVQGRKFSCRNSWSSYFHDRG